MKTNGLKSFGALLLGALAAWALTSCQAKEVPGDKPSLTTGETNKAVPAKTPRVREPAVAGLFYPKEAAPLARMIDSLLEAAPEQRVKDLKALVCPHAGYVYSGPTAAYGYRLLRGRSFKHVIVLTPSHYAGFEGASVCAADLWRTPLGDVPVSEKGKELVKAKPFVWEPRCRVQRPPWAAQSSRPLPAAGEDTPDTWEHSDEVQVPFLQRALKEFKVLTIVLGEVDPAEVARGLARVLDDQTLLIASSDLSHYHPYQQAKELDQKCVQAVCRLDLEQMNRQEACGKAPILVLMHLAKQKGWKARMLDYRNSGDTAGDKSGVVGYASIAFHTPEAEKYSLAEKKFLMDLAQRTVREVVTSGQLPKVDAASVPPRLQETKGCFVTLTKQGQLRGCIGHILPVEPLYEAVIDNARNAALRDTRFSPVSRDELSQLEFEVSVLTEPEPLVFGTPEELLAKLRPHVDGVVLRVGGRSSTFLPQVWEQLPDKVQFLNHLARKAGAGESDWRLPGTTVSTYQVEAFKESELK